MIRQKKDAPNRSATKTAVRRCRFVLLDFDKQWRNCFGREQTVFCPDRKSMVEAIECSTPESLWISPRSEKTEELVQVLTAFLAEHRGSRRPFGDLLMFESPRVRLLPSLQGWFGRVIGETRSFRKLPMEQLVEVLSAPSEQRRDVFIGGVVDRELGTLALVRGNLERITVPLSLFRPSGKLTPDFARFELDDYGHTLRFGAYEATADVVLWEVDPDYRKRSKARERAQAKGFGPSLRRLRKQRGLSQSDFHGVARKTISRIENGEVDKPHGKTLIRIAGALGVSPDEIETY